MGLINVIQLLHCPLSKQCCAVHESQQYRENNFLDKLFLWDRQESNPGQLGEKRERYLSAVSPLP